MKILRNITVILLITFLLEIGMGGMAYAERDGQAVIVPYATIVTGWWAGFSLLNASSEGRVFKVFCIDESGNPVGQSSVTVGPFAMETGALDHFIPSLAGYKARISLYIETVGNSPFIVTMFMGNTMGGFSYSNHQSSLISLDD